MTQRGVVQLFPFLSYRSFSRTSSAVLWIKIKRKYEKILKKFLSKNKFSQFSETTKNTVPSSMAIHLSQVLLKILNMSKILIYAINIYNLQVRTASFPDPESC